MTNKYYGNPLAWGGKQQPPAEVRCTCPSGDGSLRWPCPAHPPEAQPDHCRDHKRHVWGCRPCEEAAA